MRYVFVYIYYSSTSTYKIGGTMNQKKPYFYHVDIFSCCFHNSADCFVYIFALLTSFYVQLFTSSKIALLGNIYQAPWRNSFCSYN